VITPDELTDIFMDFEGSIGLSERSTEGRGLPTPEIINAA
jgi:hypothetical protein